MFSGILHLDHQLFYLINSDWTNSVFDMIMPAIRNKLTWIPLYLVLFVLVISKEKYKAWKYILLVIVCVSLSDFICSQVLKNYFDRLRPCELAENMNHIRLLIKCSGGYSMPSAHASNHACLTVLFSLFFYRYYKSVGACIFFGFWSLSIAYAQVYVGVHFPSDVIVGLLFGASIGIIGALFYQKKIVTN
jgi:undecaprenyl-diphosphatase